MDLTKKQLDSIKTILSDIDENDRIDIDKLYSLFDSKNETESICRFLKSIGALNLVFADNKIFSVWNADNTFTYLSSIKSEINKDLELSQASLKTQKKNKKKPIINVIKRLNTIWKFILSIIAMITGGLLTYFIIEWYKTFF